MDHPWISTLVVFVAMGGFGCAVDETVVARVGNRQIAVEEVQTYIISATGMPWQAVDRRAAEGLFDQFIDQEVILRRAEDHGVGEVPKAPTQRPATVRVLVATLCGEPPVPAAEDVERDLVTVISDIRPARVRARQMLLDSLEEAQSVRARLEAGEPFIDVSAERSRAANARQGGDLGWLASGTLPGDLERVLFALGEGEISTPVSSPAGYHVFQVLELAPKGPVSRAEAEPVVRQKLADDLQRTFTAQCVAASAATVGVIVYGDHLWFEYRGRYGEAADEG